MVRHRLWEVSFATAIPSEVLGTGNGDCSQVEVAAQYLHKGSRVYVAGRLHTSRWEGCADG